MLEKDVFKTLLGGMLITLMVLTTLQKINNSYHRHFEKNMDTSVSSEYCGCSRRLPLAHVTGQSVPVNMTTCGLDSYVRGFQQKVIAFSFYGDSQNKTHKNHKEKKYFKGFLPVFAHIACNMSE